MTGVQLDGIFKRYPRSMSGWTAMRRLWELFQPPERLDQVTASHLEDAQYLWALRGVDLNIERGEVVGLIGPNGSGKSSLLKIVGGITLPTAGVVLAPGRVGTLIEIGAGFHPEMTGRENVYLYGSIMGLSRREVAGHFSEIVAFAELEQFIDLPVKKYSSGMYVRLGFSVATMVPPEVLLVDEILSVGDLEFQRKSIARMRALKRSETTIIFVSHNMDAVRHFCSRAVFLLDGQIRYDGSAADAIEHYYRHADRSPVAFWPSRSDSHERSETAEVLSTTLVDDSGGQIHEIVPGEPCRLQVQFRSLQPLAPSQLAIALYDIEGTLLSSFSTKSDGVPAEPLDGTRQLTVRFPRGLPIARGSVRFSVSIMDEDCLEPFATKENALLLPVQSTPGQSGWAHIPRQWQ